MNARRLGRLNVAAAIVKKGGGVERCQQVRKDRRVGFQDASFVLKKSWSQ